MRRRASATSAPPSAAPSATSAPPSAARSARTVGSTVDAVGSQVKAGADAARTADPRGWVEPVVGDIRVRVEPVVEQLRTITLPGTVSALPDQVSKTIEVGQGPGAGSSGARRPPRSGPQRTATPERNARSGRGVPPPRPEREKVPSSEGTFSRCPTGLGSTRMLVALAGGVGAARFLRGLVRVVPPEAVTVVVNTADDDVFHGLYVCPDLDTVTYTLAGAEHPEQGWGLAGETFASMDALDRYGQDTWFRLGDRDLATHLYRTERLAEGATLSEVAAEIAAAWGVVPRLLPMSDDRVATRVTVRRRRRAPTRCSRCRSGSCASGPSRRSSRCDFDGAETAAPGARACSRRSRPRRRSSCARRTR